MQRVFVFDRLGIETVLVLLVGLFSNTLIREVGHEDRGLAGGVDALRWLVPVVEKLLLQQIGVIGNVSHELVFFLLFCVVPVWHLRSVAGGIGHDGISFDC